MGDADLNQATIELIEPVAGPRSRSEWGGRRIYLVPVGTNLPVAAFRVAVSVSVRIRYGALRQSWPTLGVSPRIEAALASLYHSDPEHDSIVSKKCGSK